MKHEKTLILAGERLPLDKRVDIALACARGIGASLSKKIALGALGVDPKGDWARGLPKLSEIDEPTLAKIGAELLAAGAGPARGAAQRAAELEKDRILKANKRALAKATQR